MDGCPGIEPWTVEGCGHDKTGSDSSRDKPGATLDPEIGDGAPKEIDGGGQDKQRDDLGASAYSDSLLAEQVRKGSLNDAVGDNGRRRDEKSEDPGTFFLGVGGFRPAACSRTTSGMGLTLARRSGFRLWIC